jgi:hypothetical protein
MCAPFLDALTFGYTIPLSADILVEENNGSPFLSWKDSNFNMVTVRDWNSLGDFPIPNGFHRTHFTWVEPYSLRLPKGYSALITHPLNRFDLPFLTFSGVVDGGWAMFPGNLPFLLQKGFTGILEQGTPIAQIIPFKQDSWELTKTPGLHKDAETNFQKTKLVIKGIYKQLFWQKKEF